MENTQPKTELLDAFSWRLLMPITEEPRVLSILPPDAEYLTALGDLFGHVTSFEQGQSQISCWTAGNDSNRAVIRDTRGDTLDLPFGDQSFDLVVISGLPGIDENGAVPPNPKTYCTTVLRDTHRILAAKGCIGLYTQNRWDYRELLVGHGEGAPDSRQVDNGSQPGRLRRVCRAWRRLSRQCLSPRQYIRALRSAGFSDVRAYVAFPDCRMPRFVVPYDRGIYCYYRRHFTYSDGAGIREVLSRLIARSGIDRFFESYFLITGVKR